MLFWTFLHKIKAKNDFFDEISQILAVSEKTWFGMHHFVLFCEKKEANQDKKHYYLFTKFV
jgi:hypothetical protein